MMMSGEHRATQHILFPYGQTELGIAYFTNCQEEEYVRLRLVIQDGMDGLIEATNGLVFRYDL